MPRINLLQWWVWLQALFRLTYYRLKIRVHSYEWLQKSQIKTLNAIGTKESCISVKQRLKLAETIHEAIRLAARTLPFNADCVPRSLVLRDLLHSRGIDAKVLIGVAKNPESPKSILSHAWVEVQGQPICEKADLKDNFRVVVNGS